MPINPFVPDIGDEQEPMVPPMEMENPPSQFVSPMDMNIDPSTMRFDPVGYIGAVGESMGNSMNDLHTWSKSMQAPESKPLITAIDSGYADKKLMNPVQEIRDAAAQGDIERVDKARKKLADMLSDTGLGPVEKFFDVWYGRGTVEGARKMGEKMAADLVFHELSRPGSTKAPTAEEAMNLGLMKPEQLIGSQAQPTYSNLIPQEPFAFSPEGEPLSSVQSSAIPAQPNQMASGMTIRPDAALTPLQEGAVATRLAMQAKMAARPTRPEKTDEFMLDLQTRIAAHRERTGQDPNANELSNIIRSARGQFQKEPEQGGLEAKKITADIAGTQASTEKTLEQAITERQTRLPNMEKTEAEIQNLYASALEHQTKASDAVRKGDMAEYRAQLEAARAMLSEMKNQVSAALLPALETDLPKTKRVEIINHIQKMMKTGLELSSMPGFLGMDFGRPNAQLNITPPGSVVPQPPTSPALPQITVPSPPIQTPQPVPQPAPQSTPQKLPPTPEEADKEAKRIHSLKKQLGEMTLEEVRLYKDLRNRGFDLGPAMEEILSLRTRKKAK